jgi:hypothetical protein
MQRWNPSSDAPPVPPSAAAVDVARGGQGEELIGTQLALNRKGFYAALCRIAANMRATDPLPDALADLLRYLSLRRASCSAGNLTCDSLFSYHILPRTCNLDGIPQFRRNEEDGSKVQRPFSARDVRFVDVQTNNSTLRVKTSALALWRCSQLATQASQPLDTAA